MALLSDYINNQKPKTQQAGTAAAPAKGLLSSFIEKSGVQPAKKTAAPMLAALEQRQPRSSVPLVKAPNAAKTLTPLERIQQGVGQKTEFKPMTAAKLPTVANPKIVGINPQAWANAKIAQGAVGAVEGWVDSAAVNAPFAGAINTLMKKAQAEHPDAKVINPYDAVLSANITGKLGEYIDKPKNEFFEQIPDKKLGAGLSKAADYAGQMGYTAGNVFTNMAIGNAINGSILSGAKNVFGSEGLAQAAKSLSKAAITPGSAAAIGASSAGNSAQQAYLNGATLDQAKAFGNLAGMLEAATEALGGGIPGLGKGLTGKLMSKLAGTPKALKTVLDILGEGGEEAITSYVTPFLERITYNPNAEAATLAEVAESFATGAAFSAIMQGANGIGSKQPITQDITGAQHTTAQDVASQATQAPTSAQNSLEVELPTESQNTVEGIVEPATAIEPMAKPREQTGPHIDDRSYSDVSSQKVKAFQFDNPELHEHFVQAAGGMQQQLNSVIKGERLYTWLPDAIAGESTAAETLRVTGNKRSASPEIARLLDNTKLSYAKIEKAVADIIADKGQENYAAAKKVELVLDDMLTNGYEVEGYQVEPDYEYIRKKEAIKSGEQANDYSMTEDEWNALLNSEPSPPAPSIFPENSLGAKIMQQLPDGTGAASLGFDPYTNALNKYGAIPEGENPARIVDVPTKTSRDTKVSRGVRTAMEAQATPDTALGDIQDAVVDGKFSYIPITDNAAKGRAEQTIQHKGWENAVKDWTADARRGVVSKDLIVLGQTLYNNAINSGNTKEGVDILVDLVKMSRSGAQATQANRVLKTLSPEYQLYALQRSVQSLSDELTQKFAKGGFDGIMLNDALVAEYLSAQTEEARNTAMDKIKDDVASQVPASWMDKWNAWRYLSMLGNPRTHVRNIVGNAGFTPVRMIKNVIATGIEKVSGKGQTKSVLTLRDRPLIQHALGDYDGVSEQIMSLGKLDNFSGDINSRRRIFKSGVPEGIRKFNTKALDVEDVWFAKPAYANALAGWYKANGITAHALQSGMVSQGKIDSGRAYAIREAQRATYRDANQFSDWVAKLGSGYTGNNKIAKTANLLVEGVLPFKRTPANILARAFEYSPAGLIKGLTNDLVQVKNGNMEAWQAIDNISAGLAGTGLLGLGAWLASMGLLSGASGDDEDKALDDLAGIQKWALNVGGKSITLDWLAPEALPLFVGVELWNAAMDKGEDGVSIITFLDKLSNITEPMFEMSMLQGVSDLLDSIKYSDNNNLVGIATTAAVNYLSQGLPTLFGQVERSFEPERKSTYTNSEKDLPTSTQRMLGKISGKIPFWEYQQTEYRDAFGKTQSNGSFGERLFNNLLNPAYTKDLTNGKVTDELRRLSDGNYLESAPDAPAKSFKYGGEPHVLSAKEYSKFQKTAGEKTYSLLDSLIGSNDYKKLSDEKKAKLVSQLMGYATDTAKREYIGEDYESSSYKKTHEAEQSGIEPTKYFIYKEVLEDIRPEGGTPAQYQYSKAINTLDLSTEYKSKLWEIQKGGESDKNPFTGALAQKNMSPEDTIKIMEEYSKVEKEMEDYVNQGPGLGKSTVQAAYFLDWLSRQGYTQAEVNKIYEVFDVWGGYRVEKPSVAAKQYVKDNPR